MADIEQPDLTTLTVNLLSAYVTNNSVESDALPALIQSTHNALSGINAPPPVEPAAPEFVPAVSVRKSIGSRDAIISLIDGKPYKTLKRHLARHGLTPAEYRERYKLPASYPMVAPAYSEERRAVAARLGLGGRRKAASAVAPEPAMTEPAPAPIPEVAPKPARKAGKAKVQPATVAVAGPPSKKAPRGKAAKAVATPDIASLPVAAEPVSAEPVQPAVKAPSALKTTKSRAAKTAPVAEPKSPAKGAVNVAAPAPKAKVAAPKRAKAPASDAVVEPQPSAPAAQPPKKRLGAKFGSKPAVAPSA